jgi:hypothetical protein
MDDQGNPISLREKMECAKTAGEVRKLLQEGLAYRFASPKTVRRLNRTAEARIKVLSGGMK